MAETQRLGLTKFGGVLGGNLGDDGGKFSNTDREIMDRFLQALEAHTHEGGNQLADPSLGPTLVLSTTGGQLPAGETLFYRTSFVDKFGLETAASPEVSVTTAAALFVPPAPALSVEAGTLEPGAYSYVVTLYQADGKETTPSQSSFTGLNTASGIRLSMAPLPTGAAGYRIYRQAPGEVSYFRLAQVTDTFYLDDGAIGSNKAVGLPTENNTNSTNSVTITTETLPVGTRAWRIYRTSTSGIYVGATLVHEVVEKIDELDQTAPLLTSWVDDGDDLRDGRPLNTSTAFIPTIPVAAGAVTAALVSVEPTVDQPTATVQAALDFLAGGLDNPVAVVTTLPYGYREGFEDVIVGGTVTAPTLTGVARLTAVGNTDTAATTSFVMENGALRFPRMPTAARNSFVEITETLPAAGTLRVGYRFAPGINGTDLFEILVDGAVVGTLTSTGGDLATFDVGVNTGAHAIRFRLTSGAAGNSPLAELDELQLFIPSERDEAPDDGELALVGDRLHVRTSGLDWTPVAAQDRVAYQLHGTAATADAGTTVDLRVPGGFALPVLAGVMAPGVVDGLALVAVGTAWTAGSLTAVVRVNGTPVASAVTLTAADSKTSITYIGVDRLALASAEDEIVVRVTVPAGFTATSVNIAAQLTLARF